MDRRRVILLLTALFLLAGLALLHGRGGTDLQDMGSALPPSEGVGEPVLRGRPSAMPSSPERGNPRDDSAHPVREGVEAQTIVQGTVLCKGDPVLAGRAFLTCPLDTYDPLRSTRIVAKIADGAFTLRIPDGWFGGASEAQVAVGAVCPAHAKSVRDVLLRQGQTTEVVLDVLRGEQLEGVVRDTSGRPVPGLIVVATTGRIPSAKSSRILDSDPVLLSPRAHSEARATTDYLGRFRLEGLGPGRYGFATPSREWMLHRRTAQRYEPPMRGIELTAISGMCFIAHVCDAESKEPIPLVRLRLRIDLPVRGSTRLTCTCRKGEGDVTWACAEDERDLAQGFQVGYFAKAFEYEPVSGRVVYEPGQRVAEVDVELRKRPMGRLLLEVAYDDGVPATVPLRLVIRGGGGFVLFVEPDTQPGVYSCTMPQGHWNLSVSPSGALGWRQLAWWGRASIDPNTEERIQVSLKTFGKLIVEKNVDERLLFDLYVNGKDVTTVLSASTEEYAAVLEGQWYYEIRPLRSKVAVQTGVVEIRRGEDTLLKVAPH